MKFQIITFYEFKKLSKLEEVKVLLKSAMVDHSIYGTFIIAEEGFNSTVCGRKRDVEDFVPKAEAIFDTKLDYKSSFHEEIVFRKQKVKVKPEIVTFGKKVSLKMGIGTHIKSFEWNKILKDSETIILDARNDYEYEAGTFKGALNPKIASFNELPNFVKKNLNLKKHKKVAIFCTGGIRCEKFAPYLKERGVETVYQLEGGILRYLEEIPKRESLWQGECFVFDERVTVDERLRKGKKEDFSISKNKKN